ncbi:MAG: transposase [Flavobacteriales bacterium]|nr:transposase [Flavobacteriales bacterium]
MGRRDNKYLLSENVEIDEGFFETIVPESKKEEPLKRGRGSQRQTMAMVFAESRRVENPRKSRPARACKYFKMVVAPNFTAKTAKSIITKHIEKNAAMITDGYKTYQALQSEFENMTVEKTPSKEAHIKLS